MPKLVDQTGKKYHRLTAIKYFRNGEHAGRWLWKCDCGNTIIPQTGAVTWGRTKSCGCLNDERRKSGLNRMEHGDAKRNDRKVLYNKWASMLSRCRNPHNKAYKYYGGRGITVCEAWKKYENFMIWAYNTGYRDDLSIDRIDNDEGYNAKNCRFVKRKEQNRNKKNNRMLTYNGETKCVGAWAEELGVTYALLYGLVYRNNHRRLLNTLDEIRKRKNELQ